MNNSQRDFANGAAFTFCALFLVIMTAITVHAAGWWALVPIIIVAGLPAYAIMSAAWAESMVQS